MKYFTLEEAEALIPELEKIYASIAGIASKAQAKAEAIKRLEDKEPGRISEITIEKSQLQFLVNGVNDWLQKILDIGAFPKGLDPTLVDFPYRLGDKEVYLCWKWGEKKITYYHGFEEGFSGRRPLPAKTH